MKTRIYYDVHSDTDENNTFMSFTGKGAKQKALAYAKAHAADETYIDRAIYYPDCDEWEYECIWCYNWE